MSTARGGRQEAAARPGRTVGSEPEGRSGRRCRVGRRPGERGMVTAELALASLAIAPLVAALGWVFAVLGLAIQCQGTANEVARQLARGDEAAATRASDAAPDGAAVRTSRSGDRVIVEVSLQASPWVSWLPAVPIELSAATLTEPEGDR